MNKKKKHYLIYQITNLVNSKIYIGKHVTVDIEDDYFGSGKLIIAAINKYGLENFVKTILFELQNEKEMNLLEKCVVTQEFCDREDTYNINVGGDGGWSYVNNNSDFAIGSKKRIENFHISGGKVCQQKYKEKYGSFTQYVISHMSPKRKKEYSQTLSNKIKKFREEHPDFMVGENNPMHRKMHSKESRMLISQAMKTDANNMKGKHWYKDPQSNKEGVFVEGQQPIGWIRGRYISDDMRKNSSNVNKGKVWITNVDTHENKLIRKEDAEVLVNTKMWRYGHTQSPISENGLANIRAANKTRQYKYHQLSNKGKSRYFNKITKEIKYFGIDESIPNGFEKVKQTGKLSVEEQNAIREFNKQQNEIAKDKWLKEVQDMADYFTKYGYEATCKKFNVSMSVESMVMKFIRARKLYGLHFESQPGKKRKFQAPPKE